ncbi:AbrB/MazE/SpoVT family DNA-binding domain-containing protein [Candidatus Woesearchaeota archaeon]|nr:AbrB/MazE/SpoVT family DNA-binding domain-containing protein [Candidatus Woesearchaeota archaeon]
MNDVECVARKWGNSLGIIIPKDIVTEENLAENEKIVVTFKKKHKAKEFFGMLPDWKQPTSELKHEMKKGWE